MTAECNETSLIWDPGGTPVSDRFRDPYCSKTDGLAEARHVFLAGNGLPEAWAGRGRFRIGELGFGTGLNVLTARLAWQRTRGPGAVLEVTSFERFPLTAAQIARALRRWAEIAGVRDDLLAQWTPAGGSFDFGDTRLTVVIGDARRTLPAWQGCADAWFLDGFAPARNPELWEPGLMAEVYRHTAPGGTAATYSAAGAVRRALEAADFSVVRRPGFGAKREMVRAVRPA